MTCTLFKRVDALVGQGEGVSAEAWGVHAWLSLCGFLLARPALS